MNEKFKVTLNRIVNGVLKVEHIIVEDIETAIKNAKQLFNIHRSSVKVTDSNGQVVKTFGNTPDNTYSA